MVKARIAKMIYTSNVSVINYLRNVKLITQKINVINNPNITASRLNLSRSAGKTTEASATKPMSEAMSESLASCFSFSLGKVNFIDCLDCTIKGI